jgi:energy-coupling factor transporter ATP-binding protein EcfA2
MGRLRLTHIELDAWEPLGGPVAFDIAPRCTVLVGRNGAGKSLVIEAMQAALRAFAGIASVETTPLRIKLTVQTVEGPRIHLLRQMSRPREQPKPGWGNVAFAQHGLHVDEEICRAEDGTIHWRVQEDDIVQPTAPARRWAGSAVRTFAGGKEASPHRALALALEELANGRQVIPAGTLRDSSHRKPIVLTQDGGAWYLYRGDDNIRLGELAETVINRSSMDPQFRLELEELGQTLGIWQRVEVVTYQAVPAHPAHKGQDLARVFFDGVDIGLLADGTLRLARILVALLADAQTIFIEEPETGLHPGLLWKLLDVIDSYSPGKQIILSTHSPQVVSWAKPEELRLVERRDEKTQVRSLSPVELAQVHAYLSEGQGTLGEYAFSGGLDAPDAGSNAEPSAEERGAAQHPVESTGNDG